MRFYLAAILTVFMALPAGAQWYARGSFGDPDEPGANGDPWNDLSNPLSFVETGHYSVTAAVLNNVPNAPYDYKIANAAFSQWAPPNNGKVYSNDDGEITFHMWEQPVGGWTDGYYPHNQHRVGYDDSLAHGWQVMGSHNGWNESEPLNLTGNNGVYTGQVAVATAGVHEFKFRKTNDWSLNQARDFSNDPQNANIEYRVWAPGQLMNYELDLPGGRWRVYAATQPDRTGDDQATAADYVMLRANDVTSDGYDVWSANYNYSPWYIRGNFNPPLDDFGHGNVMANDGQGNYTATITSLIPGADYQYKAAKLNYTDAAPGNNGKVPADPSGNITFHFHEAPAGGAWNDGWYPQNGHRIGYSDHNQFEWELLGTVQDPDWTSDDAWNLIDQGNGLHTTALAGVLLAAGDYQFKFRKQDDGAYAYQIVRSFEGSPSNAEVTLDAGTWRFELDLPGGRWRPVAVSGTGAVLSGAAVPEPASVVLAMLGALALFGTARRSKRS